MTYILGVLCFVAVVLSAVMLISSVNIRKINSRFWCVFLCVSIVCSVIFYGIHNSVLSKKTAPTIDFSGIAPQIDESTTEEKPLFEEPQIHENTESPEEPAETPASPSDFESEPDYNADVQDNSGTEPPADATVDVPSEDTTPEEDIPHEGAPPPPEEDLPSAPPEIEIEYEGPFRT